MENNQITVAEVLMWFGVIVFFLYIIFPTLKCMLLKII